MTAEHKIRQAPDLDGDGGDDMLFRRTSDGFVYALNGDDKSYLGTWGTHIQGEELLALADFDSDDRVDMLWQRSNGATFIQDSETKGGGASLWMGNYSGQELLAVTDMDGDGGDDMLFRRTSDGFVYARKGDDKSYLGTWGKHSQGEELLALADFDGDDRVDMLWQRSNGATYIQDSETQGGKPSIWMGNYSGQEPLMQSINGLYDSLGFDVGLFSEGAPTSNAAPVFTSGTTANFSENGTGTVYTAISTDEDGDTVYYSLVGGADQTLFNLDSSSGELTFKTSPDYESPADSGGDNVYNVQIDASDGNGGTASQNVAITVADSLVSAVKVYPGYTTATQQNLGDGIFGKDGLSSGWDYNGDGVLDFSEFKYTLDKLSALTGVAYSDAQTREMFRKVAF